MSMVILQLPNVKQKTEIRPKKCRYCPGETFQRWGRVKKLVRECRHRNVQVYRYRCCTCQPAKPNTPFAEIPSLPYSCQPPYDFPLSPNFQ